MGIRNIELLFPGDDVQPSDSQPEPGLVVTDIGSGVFSITGNDAQVSMISGTKFQISSPSATDNLDGSFTVTSG